MFEFKNTSLQQKQRFRLRAIVGAAVVLACFGILVSRFWVLQVERYQGFSERADRNRIAIVPIPPRRGEILDRNGEVMARNFRTYTLEVTPSEIDDFDALFDRLSKVIYLSPSDRRKFRRQLNESGRGKAGSVVLRNNLNDTEAAWFAAHAFLFPGVELKARWVRQYPLGASAAHVVGYIGRIADNDLDDLDKAGETGNYRGTDFIGKKGIEKTWENVLHGRTGIQEVEVTAGGRPVRTLRRTDPVSGSDIVLSLDMGLQRVAEQAFEGQRGALVAIDPNTGEVLAFVSMPSYDPNLFIDGIDADSWRQLNDSPDHPLIDRPLYSTYPIGSTYKPFVALAALELGKRGAHDLIPDPGYFEFGGQKFRNSGGAAYGLTDMHKAIVVSSDTYFFSLGPVIGVNALHDFTKQFGFGQITGIDLEGERAGVLPSTEWKRKAYKDKERQRWYPGESVSLTVGQGYNAFTLLQLAQATATLANDGLYRRPHLVYALRDSRTGKDEIMPSTPDHQIPLKQQNLDIVKSAMADVTRVGTARLAFQGAPYLSAGKTGTAQVFSLRGARYRAGVVDERLRDHALYIGFAPVDHPRIAVALIVENGGWGASAAAPIARKVFDYWLVNKDKVQAEGGSAAPAADSAATAATAARTPPRRPQPQESDNAALSGAAYRRAAPRDPVSTQAPVPALNPNPPFVPAPAPIPASGPVSAPASPAPASGPNSASTPVPARVPAAPPPVAPPRVNSPPASRNRPQGDSQ